MVCGQSSKDEKEELKSEIEWHQTFYYLKLSKRNMSCHDIEHIKQNQKEVERFLDEYLEANRLNLDEFSQKNPRTIQNL